MTDWKHISRDLTSRLQTDLPDCLQRQPRLSLANLPTPLHEARRFSETLGGPRVFLKRDDLTGLATGGNKTRKLEFLLADALRRGADCLLTAGGPQSNHCRQTAAAAARAGLACHLVLGGAPDAPPVGNLLLDRLLGAHIHWTPKENRERRMEELAEEMRGRGAHPYVIPVGGSNRVGALGYAAAMCELVQQLAAVDLTVDEVIFATSSGGTHAGLTVGAALSGFGGRIRGISIDQLPDSESPDFRFQEFIADLADETAQFLDQPLRFTKRDVTINYDFLGGGYGVVGDLEREAVRMLARTEGVLTGPVYTGRALGGLIELIRRGAYDAGQNVLFWHTGDESALHAYVPDFSSRD